MRLAFIAIALVLLLAPARARACGVGSRTPPYQNLTVPIAGFLLLDAGFLLFDALPFESSRHIATAELAVAASGAASFLALGLTNDARADHSRAYFLGFGLVSALLATHGAWVLARGERPTLELSAGSGLGHGTLGAQIGLRRDGFGAHLGAGMPLGRGYQGISGGLSWVGEGPVSPLVAINGALQTLPDSAGAYYGDGETRALISFSLDVGARLRKGRAFLDLAAGLIAQRIDATAFKAWRRPADSGWRAAAPAADFKQAGAWPLPIDVTLAVGVEL
jgi:hypothetical protein